MPDIDTLRQTALACRACCLALLAGPVLPSVAATATDGPDSDHPALLDNDAPRTDAETEVPAGTPIERVVLVQENIFDLSKKDENNWLYRLMNRLHIVTRPETIRKQLLFEEGDGFDPRVIAETERILREDKYLYDASIKPVVNDDDELEIEVLTRDVWTLTPEVTITRGGGENKTEFGIEESNLFGTGQRVQFSRRDDVDRTSNVFEYQNRQIGGSWTSLDLGIAKNSDGHSHYLGIAKPFHALDARWAAGLTYLDDDRRSTFYDLGDEAAEFRERRQYYVIYGGLSEGLRDGWVRRWTYGFTYDNNEFGNVEVPELPQVVPEDRKLVYPFLGYEILEDRFEKSFNNNQIDRAEDFYLGTRLAISAGWSDNAFGADRDALVVNVNGSQSFGSLDRKALLLSGNLQARHEDGSLENALLDVGATYYWRQSEKRLFFTELTTVIGHNLDGDTVVEIGGDNGLRGYPLRYQSGESSLVLSVEQRYFTDWYPFRLVRVGGAVFFDAGRVWGPNALGTGNLGWLTDAGFGLRFAPTRLGTTKVFHLDIAFPLGGADDIDSVQILIRAKRGF